MKIQPAKNKILLERLETTEREGIILSDTFTEKAQVCVILDVGEEVNKYQAGDQVVISRWVSGDIELDGKTFTFVEQDDILGKIIKEDDAA